MCFFQRRTVIKITHRKSYVKKQKKDTEQLIKITHRKRYVKKQKKDTTSSKDDELDLLGDEDVDSFTGSH